MFAVASAPTTEVVTLNVAEVAPAATVTVAGTVAAALSDVRATDRPPVGAGPLIVTVATEVPPPTTEVGLSEIPEATAALTTKVAFAVPAVIVTDLPLVRGVVVIAIVADVAPWATVTELGTVTEASLDEVAMVTPPVGAGPLRVTVPTDAVPPVTVEGFNVRPEITGALIVKVGLRVVPPTVAETVPTVSVATGLVVIGNVATVCPALIVTDVGTVAALFVVETVTSVPPAGAGVVI